MNDRYQTHSIGPTERTDEILKLLSSAMTRGETRWGDDSYWNWKHVINPAGPSLVHVATDEDGRIASTRALMQWRFVRGDEVVQGFRAVDSATWPEHQRKGLFTQITARAIEDAANSSGALVLGNPGGNSLAGYERVGFKVFARARSQIRRRSGVSFRNIGRASLDIARDLVHGRRPAASRVTPRYPATLASSEQFADAIRHLHSDSDLLRTEPSPEFVNWRFVLDPRFDHGLYVSRSGGNPDWAIAYRLAQRVAGYRVCVIDQIESAELSEGQLGEIVDFIQSVESVDEIRILALDERDSGIFKQQGFLPAVTSRPVTCFPLSSDFGQYAERSDLWKLQNGDINGI